MVENRERTLLLVEDNQDEEELVVRVLRKGHIKNPVVVCRDGAAALEYIFGIGKSTGRNPTDYPAVTMLDLKLPKIDGLTILRRIRADERTRLMPVVVFTSSNMEADILSCYEAGANSVVRKPVEFEQYVDAVRKLVLYWVFVSQPPPIRASLGGNPEQTVRKTAGRPAANRG